MNSNESNHSQPELHDHDKWLSWETGCSLLSWKWGEGLSTNQGQEQGLRLPDLAGKLKSLEQFIETPE